MKSVAPRSRHRACRSRSSAPDIEKAISIAARAEHGRSWKVVRQIQRLGAIGELLVPVRPERLGGVRGEQRVLPAHVVRVLNGERLEIGRLASDRRTVEHVQLAGQDRQRRAVHQQMVEHEQQAVPLDEAGAGGQPADGNAPERGLVERERARGFSGRERREAFVRVALVRPVDRVEARLGARHDLLPRLAVDERNPGTQDVVAGHQPRQRLSQRRHRECTLHDEGARHVVGATAAGAHLLEDPEPALGVRERMMGRGRRGLERDAAERLALGDRPRQPGDGRVREQIPQPDRQQETLLRERDDARRAQAVPADLEEIVADPNACDAQHPRPDVGEGPLQLVPRRRVLGARRQRERARLWQRGAIHLAVPGERQPVERHEVRRNHGTRGGARPGRLWRRRA